ncbi:MAG TPA: phosphatidylglycerol lysyltransferase domain-containing protein [Gaiellaceae bacterium]|nr:phosphatidylglycerol lysyltransferase domain-containing protein [Gaiellaceae bacterium]
MSEPPASPDPPPQSRIRASPRSGRSCDGSSAAGAQRRRATEVSLNFCVFTDLLSPERAVGRPRRLARRVLLAADGIFQLERLYAFNRKFFPEWRPRYVCVERLSDLPLVGFAYLCAESLLIPPGPWVRRERRIADASV